MRYKAAQKHFEEKPFTYYNLPNNQNNDNHFLSNQNNFQLKIFDPDYNSIQELYDGVKSGDLLIHCKPLKSLNDAETIIYPQVGETVKDAYLIDFNEEDIPQYIYASDNFNWAHDRVTKRQGVYFIYADNFQRYIGDGAVQEPNGCIWNSYDIGAPVEIGDWFSDQPAYVAAVLFNNK